MCRSRRELSNAYFVANFRFDGADNERAIADGTTQTRQTREGWITGGRFWVPSNWGEDFKNMLKITWGEVLGSVKLGGGF